MKKVLITYATQSGSTAELAEFMGRELTRSGAQVEVKPIHDVKDIKSYDAVVVGGPMLMGWHADAVKFLKENQQTLQDKQVACFASALSLTKASDSEPFPLKVFQDPSLAKSPVNPGRLSFKEKFSALSNYIAPMLTAAPLVKPESVAFFAGKLDLSTLNIFSRLFVQFIIGAKPGDYRNWDSVRTWTASLSMG